MTNERKFVISKSFKFHIQLKNRGGWVKSHQRFS